MTQQQKATPQQQQAPHIHTTTALRIVTATTQVKANEGHRMNAIFCETGVKSTPLYHVMLPQHLQDRAHQDTPSAQTKYACTIEQHAIAQTCARQKPM